MACAILVPWQGALQWKRGPEKCIKKHSTGTSLVVPWLRLMLPLKGAWVRLLVRELKPNMLCGAPLLPPPKKNPTVLTLEKQIYVPSVKKMRRRWSGNDRTGPITRPKWKSRQVSPISTTKITYSDHNAVKSMDRNGITEHSKPESKLNVAQTVIHTGAAMHQWNVMKHL